MFKTIFVTIQLLAFGYLFAQVDTTTNTADEKLLEIITISADKSGHLIWLQPRSVQIIDSSTIKHLSSQAITDILKYAFNVDVRDRGMPGVQADIQIQGGTFEQTLILLNGIPVNDPQTGHFNSNIPLDPSLISKIEILPGASSRMFGMNASAGVINIVTKKQLDEKISFSTSVGSYNTQRISLASQPLRSQEKLLLHAQYATSDGYVSNTDYKAGQAYVQFYKQFGSQTKPINLLLFLLNGIKGFGAYNFYTPKFPYQYERNIITMLGSNLHYSCSHFQLYTDVYFRRHQDRFELFRHDIDTLTIPAWYKTPNFHINYSMGLQYIISLKLKNGKIITGLHLRNDLIYSNVLGNISIDSIKVPFEQHGYFTKMGNRFSLSFPINYQLQVKKWLFSSGAMLSYYQPSQSWNILPGVDISYLLPRASVYLSMNYNNRFPSFTEMYYTDANHLPNEKLTPEKFLHLGSGIRIHTKRIYVQIQSYYKDGKNLIDWVKNNPNEKWQAANLPRVQLAGIENQYVVSLPSLPAFNMFMYMKHHLKIGFVQNFMVNYQQSAAYTKYAFDYLQRQIIFNYMIENLWKLDLIIGTTYQKRHGSFLDAKGNVILYRPLSTFMTKASWKTPLRNSMIRLYGLMMLSTKGTYYLPNVEVLPLYMELGTSVLLK